MVSLAAFADELEKISADPADSESAPSHKPSLLRRLLPAALGAAAGLGAYKYMRRVNFSKIPSVRRMQEAAKGRLTQVDTLWRGQKEPGRIGKFIDKHIRGVDDVVYEPHKSIRAREKMSPEELKKILPRKIEGAVQTFGEPHQARAFKGDFNVTPDPDVAHALGSNKLTEAKLLAKLPGGAPKSDAVSKFLKPGKATPELMDDLQKRLDKQYPNGYVIKPINDAASGGVPRHTDRFSEILAGKGDELHQHWMKDMTKRPDQYMVQEFIPINKSRRAVSIVPKKGAEGRRTAIGEAVEDEWRVHVVNGRVVPDSTHHRWAVTSVPKEIAAANSFMQKAVDNMPKGVRNTPLAADVVRGTDGKLRIMELNAGGQSGFLIPSSVDPTNRAHRAARSYYRHVTGRAPVSSAVIRGVGAGAATTLAGHAALREKKTEEKA